MKMCRILLTGSILSPFSSLLFSESNENSATDVSRISSCSIIDKPMRLGVRYTSARGIGYSQGYTTFEGFFSHLFNEKHLPFLDLRSHVFDNGKFAANAGIGFRSLLGCRTYGVSSFYDYRNTKHQHYNQVSLALESLGVRWDFRVNGYLPVGDKQSSKYDKKNSSSAITFDSFSGNYALLKQTFSQSWKKEYAMKGLDFETEYHFMSDDRYDVYVAARPYYYNYKSKNAIGGQVRIGAKLCQYISLELINSYDSLFHERFQG